jgi:agmatinase
MTSAFDPAGPSVHDGIFGLPHGPDEARVVLVPVPWQPTTSYRKGTAGGPAAILAASRQVDLFDRQTGRPYEHGIAMLPIDPTVVRLDEEACILSQPIIDAGGAGDDTRLASALREVNASSRTLDDWVERTTQHWLDRGKLVGVVGGDHSSPLGAIRAIARKYPGLGVLHVDAHADLREAYEGFVGSHASIMFNVHAQVPEVAKIVQVGIRDLSEEEHDLSDSSPRILTFYDHDLAKREAEGEAFARVARDIVDALPKQVYVSFDIDGLDPTLCPNTGTPVPGGLSFRQTITILETIRQSGREIVGFDLCEVAGKIPHRDTEWDANVGARVLYKLIGFALVTRR